MQRPGFLKSAFFWRLYLTFSSLFLLVLGGVCWLITQDLETALRANIENNLKQQSSLLRPTVEGIVADAGVSPTLRDERLQAVTKSTPVRVTVIALDGRVLADSETPSATMENHGQRPEVVDALATGQPAFSQRHSATTQLEYVYAAEPVVRHGAVTAVIRLALPLTHLQSLMMSLRLKLLTFAGLGSLVALFIGGALARKIATPLEQMIKERDLLDQVRRDFVANVSHELKTPLTSIKGYVETLLNGALRDEKNNVKFLEKIESNVGRLVNLVQDLLSLARIEAAEGDALELAPVRWESIVTSVLHRHDGSITAKHLLIHNNLAGLPSTVSGDRDSMTQVLENLLDNAIKYTPNGGHIYISYEQRAQEGVLEVRDTGIGIPQEDLDRIFERFYRVDKARSREVGGTGLGLAIVKHLIFRMQGRIDVESQVGSGSVFRVILPIAAPH